MKQYGDRGEEKLTNKGRIARFISLQGTTSKAEISSRLNLSMPTTLQNVKLLIEEGIVEETGEYASTGGRKAKALSVRSDAGYGAGVDITNNHVTMVMVNGKKEMIAGKRSRIPYENSPRYYEELIKAVKAFMESQEIDQSKIAGVGFSLPGIVDREHCLLLRSHTLRVENVSFRSLGDSLGYPYGIENDANSAAFAELGRETENAVYLSLSNGRLGQLVRDGIQHFPEVTDHVKMPGDKTVHCIRHAGYDQQDPGPQKIFFHAVEPHEYRDEAEPEERKQVRDRQYFILRIIFLICISHS